MFIEINGARLFFDSVGPKLEPTGDIMAERPTMLVLHGGPGFDHSLMRPYFDRFSDTHQVVYLDHRGNGRSGGEQETWNLPQWGDDIAAFCATLGIERPVVYGLSFGGMVAMSYATRHPDGPSKLILSSTAAKMDWDATYAMFERLGGAEARAVAERFWSAPTTENDAEYMRVCLPLYNPGAALNPAAVARAVRRTEVMSHFFFGENRAMDFQSALARVPCPTLILGGGLDPITPPVCSRAIHAALPEGVGELVLFDAAGHGAHRDLPDEAEVVLRRFLAAG